MRYKLTIEYDGTDYSGWQKQDNSSSIQEHIEIAIEKFCGEKLKYPVQAERMRVSMHLDKLLI